MPLPPPHVSGQTSSIVLGAHSYVGSFNLSFGIEAATNILIGRYTSIAGGITIISGLNHIYKNAVTTYPFDAIYNEFLARGKTYLINEMHHNRRLDNRYQVIIGHDVWIGNGSTIIGGVKIGSGAIIGSNSMVTKDVPPYAIAVGNPARVVKYRFDEETIKKFMAVKWWNWDIDKVCANVHKMYDVEKFLAEHYNPALENIPEDILGKEVEKYRAEGRKVYTFIADFRSPSPLWRRVLRGLLMSNLKDSAMIFFLGLGATDKDLDEVRNFPQTMERIVSIPIVKIIPPFNGQIFSLHTLRKSTHFITTRDMITLECLDWLHDTDVKILSAMDDGIFEGEPPVDWSKI